MDTDKSGGPAAALCVTPASVSWSLSVKTEQILTANFLRSRQVMFTSWRWDVKHGNLSHHDRQSPGKLKSPSCRELTQAVDIQHVGDAAVTHVHFRLVLLPALLHQLFQRLGHDLYQTTTTKHVGDGREGAGTERSEPQMALSASPRPWRVGVSGQGRGAPRRMGRGGERGWSGTPPAARRHANPSAMPRTLTTEGGTYQAGRGNDRLSQSARLRGRRTAPGLRETRTRTRNTPCPGAPRRRTQEHAQLHSRRAPGPSQIRRTVY